MSENRQSDPQPNVRPEPQGLAARRAALGLIDAALARRGGMEEVEGGLLAGLEPRDRAFARALTIATLRWLGPIDRQLAERLSKAPPPEVTALLRIGAAQMLALGSPPHAAVSTTVDLASSAGKTRPYAKLVNAVLRGIARTPCEPAPTEFVPDWLMARWRNTYGEAAYRIAARVREEPPTDLSLRDPSRAAEFAEALEGQVLAQGSVRTSRRGRLSEWPGFEEGVWWVQDAAAALPARLLNVQPGETVLDMCAAPGGKTMQLCAAGASVTAIDRSAARLERLKENLTRMGLEAETVAGDAQNWSDERRFDAVLLDAPCSATGTFRRHPDVLWTAKPSDIVSLAGVQSRMLDAAAARVRSGGRLVYCVCSLEAEEGEAQVDAFLLRRPEFDIDPIGAGDGGAPVEAATDGGTLRLHSGLTEPEGGLDGFFIARLRRR